MVSLEMLRFIFIASISFLFSISYAAAAERPVFPCKNEGVYGFSGGTPFAAQLIGSHGPGKFYEYSWSEHRPTNWVADIQLVTGFPNAIDSILWGKGIKYSPGNNVQTAECSTGWGCLDSKDSSKIWESGVLFHSKPFGYKDIEFCHILELKPENYKGKNRSVLYAWDIYWTLGQPYSCPATLIDALNGKNKFKDSIHYLVAPNTGQGLPNVPVKYWTCKGEIGGVVGDKNEEINSVRDRENGNI
jgi:hypothetical protein